MAISKMKRRLMSRAKISAPIGRGVFGRGVFGRKISALTRQDIKRDIKKAVKRDISNGVPPEIAVKKAVKKQTVAIKRQNEKVKKVKINRAKFLSWVKTRHPKIYRMALLRAGSRRHSLSGLGQEGDSWWDTVVSGIKEMIPAALQFKQQKDLMNMQLKRAEAGLPPANVADYTPVLKIQTELAPETRTALIDQLGKPVIFGALALGAFMLLKK